MKIDGLPTGQRLTPEVFTNAARVALTADWLQIGDTVTAAPRDHFDMILRSFAAM
jgi:hypothetical protein